MELTLFFLALAISLLYALSKLILSSCNGPVLLGPTALAIIRNLLHVDKQPHRCLSCLAKVYGPIMSLKLGLNTVIVVSSPEVAREVLQLKDAFFSARSVPDSLRACNHHDALMFFLPSTSPLWRRNRAICATNLFSARSMEATKKIRAQKAYDIINNFHKKTGHPVPIGEIIFAGMLNMISNVLLSQDVVDIDSESPQEFTKLIKECIHENLKPNISDFIPFLSFLDLQGRRRTAAGYYQRCYKFFDVIIDARLRHWHGSNGENNYGDFLDSLLDLYAESKITRREIQLILTEIFAAGSDTTSVVVEWAMGELIRNPIAMAKAQAEVRKQVQTLAEPDVVNLPFLQAVIKEVMRLHPPGPLLLRKAMQDGVDISGYVVPKGAQVIVNAWAIGRDPQLWIKPDVFKPERFLEKQISFHGRDFKFIPFGSGKRICPGLSFAVKVVPLLLGLLLAEFDWRLPDGMEPKDVDVTEKFTSVLEIAVPLCLVPVPVNN